MFIPVYKRCHFVKYYKWYKEYTKQGLHEQAVYNFLINFILFLNFT